jgi:GH15 family glucan-1,4-alpha-glucosidase
MVQTRPMSVSKRGYRPLGDYALIGDCHSAALVSRDGSIDWCCLPRFDSGSVFGRLLDAQTGGHFRVAATDSEASTSRRYLDDTLVLVTTFETRTGQADVYDCFATSNGDSPNQLREVVRIVEGTRGTLEFAAEITPRFDYGALKPWLRHHGRHLYSAVGGDDAITITSDADLTPNGLHDLVATFTVRAGTRFRFLLTWYPPEQIDPAPPTPPTPDDIDRRLDETVEWWRRWAGSINGSLVADLAIRRSALVLKALTHDPTGAVVAAITTSLPESLGATRNWDYRFSWIRDSQFTVRSLGDVGCVKQADGFRRFVERSAAGSAESLQIMFGVGGERRLTELTLPALDGYEGSRPVRIGNSASEQIQLDVYGYLLDLAWRWHERGRSPDDDYWRFLVSLVDAAAEQWQQPDCGIWEVRGKPQHFVHSKVMCWAALDRGIRLADACLRAAPIRRWKKVRTAIRGSVEGDGFDRARGVFRRSFGSDDIDAALLLLPTFDFAPYADERMIATTAAIRVDLDDHGFVRRYSTDDGLTGREGVFIACTFWLAEALAEQGQTVDAQETFDRAAATANDVGLFTEEYDPSSRILLGNMPQGLSHLSHIAAALALARHAGKTAEAN